LLQWIQDAQESNHNRYSAYLHSESDKAAINIAPVAPEYDESAPQVDARIVIRDNFDAIFAKRPEVLIFGEDAGKIGDVNQGLEGMQDKYGEVRVSDTGIREATILGQGIGMAMRGLRPQRSPSRRNPLYVPPTPEQAAWQHVTGTFRAFAEWASDDNLTLARKGMREAQNIPFHDLDAKAIAQGSAAFTTIKEWFDA
jgi:hypothetical protein